MSSFFYVPCRREGEETITARTPFSFFTVSRHLDISYFQGRVSLCSTSPVHPSHCSSTRHILRSVVFSHVCFYASDYIYHIRLYYAPSLVPTYVLRSGVEFFAAGERCGWWFWDGVGGVVRGVGVEVGHVYVVLTLSGAMFCARHCWYYRYCDNTTHSPSLTS